MSDGGDPPADATHGGAAPSSGRRGREHGLEEAGSEGSARGASGNEGSSPGGAPDSGARLEAQGTGACPPCVPRLLAALLGAAALGGLGAWLYLHYHRSAESRASHRIEELQGHLDQLSRQLAEYARRGRQSRSGPA